MEKRNKKMLATVFACALVCAVILLNVPLVQNAILMLGEKLKGGEIRRPEKWITRMRVMSTGFFVIAAWMGCMIFRPFLFALFTERFRHNARLRNTLVALGIVVIAFATSLFFNTSPVSNNPPTTDSAVFMYIGKGMHRGLVPYKDMFDHKGIALYFINWLGTFVDGNIGIYLIELVGMFVATLFTYKTAALATKRTGIRLLATFIVVFWCGKHVYEGGNLTETYALPWLAYANYAFLKYPKIGDCRFREFFFSGIAFAVVLLLRVNMVALWAFYGIYLLAFMLQKRKFGDIKMMAAGLVCGAGVVIIPSFVYLLATDSLRDMWECYVVFNFKYISSQGGLRNNVFVALKFMGILALPVFCMAVTLFQKTKETYYLSNILTFFVSLFFITISGRDYPHYAVALLPFCTLPMAHIFGRRLPYLRLNKLAVGLGLFAIVSVLAMNFPVHQRSDESDTIVRFLREETAADDDVLVLGNDVTYNIQSSRFTKQRFFYQTVILLNRALWQEFEIKFFSSFPDYVVVCNARKDYLSTENRFNDILTALDKNYTKHICSDGDVYVRY